MLLPDWLAVEGGGTHAAEILVEQLHVAVNDLQGDQLIVLLLNRAAEIQAGVSTATTTPQPITSPGRPLSSEHDSVHNETSSAPLNSSVHHSSVHQYIIYQLNRSSVHHSSFHWPSTKSVGIATDPNASFPLLAYLAYPIQSDSQ